MYAVRMQCTCSATILLETATSSECCCAEASLCKVLIPALQWCWLCTGTGSELVLAVQWWTMPSYNPTPDKSRVPLGCAEDQPCLSMGSHVTLVFPNFSCAGASAGWGCESRRMRSTQKRLSGP